METQVVAYLEGLVRRGHCLHLLTYETGSLSPRRRRALRGALRARGIRWHGLRYHKRPSLPATVFDVVAGILTAAVIVWRERIEVVHARSHVPVVVALALNRLTGVRFVFDIRGLMAEEYVDAGRWAQGGLPFRLTKRVERAAIRRASAIVVLTSRVAKQLFGAEPPSRVHVIPCCADVERIAAQRADRVRGRARLGLEGRTVLVYVGKFSGWYMEREMVQFFSTAQRQHPNLLFLILTQSDQAEILNEFRRASVPPDAYRISFAPPEHVGEYLAAADAAISFIRRCPSKISSSPTKIGEYLAAGLPVLSSAGIGDVDELLGRSGIGVLIDRFDAASYAGAAERLWELAADPLTAERCMATARTQLSLREIGVPAYDTLYRSLAAGVAPSAG